MAGQILEERTVKHPPSDTGSSGPTPPFQTERIPQELRERDQWVGWRSEVRDGKDTKVLYDTRTRRRAKSNDRGTWGSFDDALRAFGGGGYDGIGFVFSTEDPYSGIDLDNAIGDDGQNKPWAQELIDLLPPGGYLELSPSGQGLHAIVRGQKPGTRCRIDYGDGKVEIYDQLRYFTMTGRLVDGAEAQIVEAQDALEEIYRKVFGEEERRDQAPVLRSSAAVGLGAASVGTLRIAEDARAPVEKLERFLDASQKFRDTWEGRRPDLNDQSPSGYDLSLADQLWGFGLQDQEIIDALIEWRRIRGHRPKPRLDYYARTLEKAKQCPSASEQREALLSDDGLLIESDQSGDDAELPAAGSDVDSTDDVAEAADGGPKQTAGERDTRVRAALKLDPLDKPKKPNTHRANAWRIANRHGHELRNVSGLGFLIYDGRRWRRSDNEGLRLAARVSAYICEEAAEVSREAARTEDADYRQRLQSKAEMLNKWARASEQGNAIRESLKLTVPLVSLDAKGLDTHEFLLNVENGTLDLMTGQLRPHDPRDLLTKMAPVEYDRDAEAPRWQAFIEEIIGERPQLIRFVQKALGYSMTGSVREQCLFFAHGAGQNGKTTLLEAMREVLGPDYVTKAAPDLLMSSKFGGSRHSEIADLRGARIVISQEVADGKMFDSQLMKDLTGERWLKGRHLYKAWIEFPATFTIWFSANHRPQTRDNTLAFWRRIRLIPFTQTIGKADRNLSKRLAVEKSGILNWLLEGVRLYFDEGLAVPPEVTEAVAEYRRESDGFGKFIMECCDRGKGLEAKASELREAYEAYAGERGLEMIPARKFKAELLNRGYQEPRRRGSGYYYRGLALKSETAAEEDPRPQEEVN